jgi:hypothetical protein
MCLLGQSSINLNNPRTHQFDLTSIVGILGYRISIQIDGLKLFVILQDVHGIPI